MAEPIRVMLVDDHAVLRAGLASILAAEPDIDIVAEAKDGWEAIAKARLLNPDVILMDIFMPRCSGLDAIIVIKESLPNARVLILTVSDREEDLFQALRFGAQGYLLKSASITEVVDGVRRTAAGEVMLSLEITRKLVAEFRQKADRPELSQREGEILQLLGEGFSNTEIGHRLFISESTVRTYIRRLLDKLHLRNRAEAIGYACRHSLSGKPT